ncbi:hypothetical protein [Zobellella denitrificans]
MIRLRAAGPADLTLLRRWDQAPQVRAADPNDECLVFRLARADWRPGEGA